MLVLSRQRDETIMIGDDIEITIVDIRGDKVRLGINAPNRIAVHRKEVYEAIRKENEQASSISDDDLQRLKPSAISAGPPRRSVRVGLKPTVAPVPGAGASTPTSNGAERPAGRESGASPVNAEPVESSNTEAPAAAAGRRTA